jgi:hypothetical protein
MGHSTGSQDVIHYLSSPTPMPEVQGGIMQAPCSDREYFEKDVADGKPSMIMQEIPNAWDLIEEGRGDEIVMKNFLGMGGITAWRLVSLCAVG